MSSERKNKAANSALRSEPASTDFIRKPGKMWWLQNTNSTLYAAREFTGVVIAFWAIYTLAAAIFPYPQLLKASLLINITGLAAALVHSVTWFMVMPKLVPFRLTLPAHIILSLFLIIFWGAASYIVFLLI